MAEITKRQWFQYSAADVKAAPKSKRMSAQEAEYMELYQAIKDADCEIVEVEGGVSSELGCCDRYEPQATQTQTFKCGVCKYLELK